MKKTLLSLLIALLSANLLPAQGPGDYQFQFQFENTLKEWVKAPDGAWFGAGWSVSYPSYPMGVPFVMKWNAQKDSMIWRTEVPMPLAERVWDVALLPTSDGGIFAGAVFDGCDYPTQDAFARLDAGGNILWVSQSPEEYREAYRLWLFEMPNGNLLFQTDQYQFESDPNGALKWADKGWFSWGGIVPRQEGDTLFYGYEKLGLGNPFSGIAEQPFPDIIRHALQLPSGNWLFLGNDHIYRLSADFSVLNKQQFAGQQIWNTIFETGGDYWVAAENIADEGLLLRIDTATLGVLSAHNFGTNYRVKSVLYEPGDSLLWLSGEANFYNNRTVFLKSAPRKNPAVAPDRSLSLAGIRLETTPKTYLDLCGGFDGASGRNFRIGFGKVFVTVKNTGSTPVQKFRVNGHFDRCSDICVSYEQISETFDLTLAPGDSTELLLLDDFDLDGQEDKPAFNLCFWTAVPDERLDGKPEDDRFCKTFSVLVSDQEPIVSPLNVQAFPNPSAGDITFNIGPTVPGQSPHVLSLTNPAGQTVLREPFSGNEYRLSRGLLPAGIYFYEISAGIKRLGKGKVVLTGE